jgi:hypothetical protein
MTARPKIKHNKNSYLKNICDRKKLGTAHAMHLASGPLPVKGPKNDDILPPQ